MIDLDQGLLKEDPDQIMLINTAVVLVKCLIRVLLLKRVIMVDQSHPDMIQ